jgi:6-phosphogluconolactonase/glucosamine-6-phosphate isomerase/deaminase
MSLGPRQVREADHVVVAVSGSTKHDLARQLLSFDSYSAQFPLSIIHHPHVADRVEMLLPGM